MKIIFHIGRYFSLMFRTLRKPERFRVYMKQVVSEIDSIGINSIGIVAIVSVFMGAVLIIQMAINFVNPLIPKYLISLSVRDTMLLEFTNTVVCLILAGRVGSNIASEIGTMRITEQIDALEMMGINSAGYLILPKIIAAIITFPFINLLSVILGIIGGYGFNYITRLVSMPDFIYGLHYYFIPFYVTYSLIKMVVFAIIITTVSAYHGYFTQGGALEVGRSSTRAVVYSIILILFFDLVLTQILLT
ncbi:MAG: ABC transporter permease [Bacteroidales bacterium]|nr:ABC transporter permease [Bacteroidales bacterium]